MALTGVKISEETYLTCLTHALSTETEEIMGLLLGDIEAFDKAARSGAMEVQSFELKLKSESYLVPTGLIILLYLEDGSAVALVWWAAPQTRSDRRKDRVETNPEQLAAATAQAEKMSVEIGRTTRVIGWYHSHPHITVQPSHVDVRTQKMYQMLDPGFVGVILSCFSEDANKVGRIQVIAFQSQDGQRRDHRSQGRGAYDSTGDTSRSAPVVPSSSETETLSTSKASAGSSGNKQQSAALENLFAIADSEARGAAGTSTSEDEHLSMQEAMHLSTLEASGAEFVRKEIPLEIVPGNSLVKLAFPLAPLVELQRTLFQEEQAAFRQAIAQSTVNGQIHPLAVFHHEAQYQATLSKLLEYCLCPALQSLTDKNQQNKIRLMQMQDDAQAAHMQRLAVSSKAGSPRSPQAVGRSPSHRSGGSSSSGGRLSSDVFQSAARRSSSSGHRGTGGARATQETKPDSPDLIRF